MDGEEATRHWQLFPKFPRPEQGRPNARIVARIEIVKTVVNFQFHFLLIVRHVQTIQANKNCFWKIRQ